MARSTVTQVLLDKSILLPNPEMSDTLQIQFQLFDLAPRPGILLLRVHPQGLCQLRLSLNSAPPVEIKLQKSPPFSIHEIYPAEFLRLINQLDITVSGPGSVVLSDGAFLYEIEVASKAEVDSALRAPALAFVFRPGGVAQRNVYTSFGALVDAMSEVEGRKVLEFDDSIQRPCSIPARAGGGAWPMKDVLWTGFAPRGQGAFRAEVAIEDGARFTDLRMFGGSLTVFNRATTLSPISDFGPGENHVHVGLNGGTCEFVNEGAAPMFDLGGNSATFFVQNSFWGVRSTAPLIRHTAGACRMQLLGLTVAGKNMVASAAPARVIVNAISSATTIGANQTSTANFEYVPVARIQRRIVPLPNGPAPIDPATIRIPNALLQLDGTAAITQRLPAIDGFLLPGTTEPANSGGQEIVVAEVKGGTGLQVEASQGNTIDGSTQPVPIAGHGSRTFISDGISNWITVAVTP
jgi:hypothetical protein